MKKLFFIFSFLYSSLTFCAQQPAHVQEPAHQNPLNKKYLFTRALERRYDKDVARGSKEKICLVLAHRLRNLKTGECVEDGLYQHSQGLCKNWMRYSKQNCKTLQRRTKMERMHDTAKLQFVTTETPFDERNQIPLDIPHIERYFNRLELRDEVKKGCLG